MMPWLKNPKAIQQACYRWLEADGFVDAEEIVGGEHVLKQNASHVYRNSDGLTRDCKAEYFRILSQKIHETEFPSEIDKVIICLHAEGKKIKAICEALTQIGHKRHRETIRHRIRQYEMRWGMREYTVKQLKPWLATG